MKIATDKSRLNFYLPIVVSCIAIIISLFAYFHGGSNDRNVKKQDVKQLSLLEKLETTNELHVGYGVYPPYTIEDPNTKEVTGFSVDVINEIAKELNVKVVWHRINWNTMSADLKRGDFDVIADPIFQTIPRAREFSFTDPYAFFAEGIAVVKKSDNRFKTFKDIDKKNVVIAVGQGWSSETFVKANIINAEIKPIQTNTDLLQLFNEVTSGRADVAIADGADAKRFTDEHSDKVKVLWLQNPPAFVPAGFALRPNDKSSAEFLNVCLRNLKFLGVIDGLASKYNITNIVKSNE